MKNLDTLHLKNVVRRCKLSTCDTNQIDSSIYHLKSMVPVYYLDFDSEKVLFYICMACGYFDFKPFRDFRLSNNLLQLAIFKIPNIYLDEFEKLRSTRWFEKCIFCGQDRTVVNFDEPVKDENGKVKLNVSYPMPTIRGSVYKIFLKGQDPRRDHIGYLCVLCKKIYILQSFDIFPHDSYPAKIDVLDPCRILSQEKNKHEEEYKNLKNKKGRSETLRIARKVAKTWHNLVLFGEPFGQRVIEFDNFRSVHTNVWYDEPVNKKRMVTVTLQVSEKRALELIDSDGTQEQKASIKNL